MDFLELNDSQSAATRERADDEEARVERQKHLVLVGRHRKLAHGLPARRRQLDMKQRTRPGIWYIIRK